MRFSFSVLVALFTLAIASFARADPKIIVGTKESPPFAMKSSDGQWTGISIELWKELAANLHYDYEIRDEGDVAGLLGAVEAKQIDIGVASTTVTAEREAKMDFTHPIYSTGLSIAIKPGGSSGPLSALRGLLTWDMAELLGGVFGLLAIVGALVWLFERRHNDAQFAKHPVKGIAAGVWWSAVTMTTVGYGDKSPITIGGRVLALVWMFSAIIIIAFFTASITSTLTVDRLESAIKGPEDLPKARVATVAGSTSAAYLDKRHISYKSVKTVMDGLHLVASDEVDAMVYDAPILKYLASHDMACAVTVLPGVFQRQDYAFALPDGSALREPINRAMLTELGSDHWSELLERYLGKE